MVSDLRTAKSGRRDESSHVFAASGIHTRIVLNPGSLVGFMDRIFCFAPGTFKPALDLLSNAFNLERCVAGQLARSLPHASRKLVNSALHSILVHWPAFLNLAFVHLNWASHRR